MRPCRPRSPPTRPRSPRPIWSGSGRAADPKCHPSSSARSGRSRSVRDRSGRVSPSMVLHTEPPRDALYDFAVPAPLTATSAVFGQKRGDLLPGFVGDLSASDHTHSSSSQAIYEQKLSWILVFIRQTVARVVDNAVIIGYSPNVREVEFCELRCDGGLGGCPETQRAVHLWFRSKSIQTLIDALMRSGRRRYMAYWMSRGKPSEAERSLTSLNRRCFDRNRRGRRVLYRPAREGRSARDIRTQTSGILAAEVVDLACAQATDAQPRVLHRFIRLRERPHLPVGHRPQTAQVLLQTFGKPSLLVHPSRSLYVRPAKMEECDWKSVTGRVRRSALRQRRNAPRPSRT